MTESHFLRVVTVATLGVIVALSPCEARADAAMAHLASLSSLELLVIGGHLTDKGLSYLAAMRNLHVLSVAGDFSDEGLRHLEGLRALASLNITSEGAFGNEALDRLRDTLPNVQVFRVVP